MPIQTNGWELGLKQSLERATSPKVDCPDAQAGVVVGLRWDPCREGFGILLTKRSLSVRSHRGEICFPGGTRELGDKHLLDTALRETREEIGVQDSNIKVVGRLPTVHTRAGVGIVPWLAMFDFSSELFLSEEEVERVFYLPLSKLREEGFRTVSVELPGAILFTQGICWEGELIWGATARILMGLRERLLPKPSLLE